MFFGGYIRIKTLGSNVTYFIDKCKKEGYSLYNVRKSDNVCFFDIKWKELKKVFSLAEKCNLDPQIYGRFGLAMKLFIYKSRKAFFLILLVLSLFYGVNSCFISEISLSGNKIFADKQILDCLQKNGLYVGRLKFGINPVIFQNDVIKDFSGLSWVWVKIDGTRAIVEVREKISLPEFFDYTDYGNVVASKDGVIKSAIASGGTLLVSEGMYVQKGDILINGVYDSTENAPVRFINADGMIFASTTYTIEDNFGYNYISYKPAEKMQTKLVPKIFDINLWNTQVSNSKALILSKKEIKYRIFGKNYLPLAFTKTKYCEIIKKEYVLSEERSQELALKEISRKLELSLPVGAEIVDVKNEIEKNPDGGTFKARVTFSCIENIATKQPIEVETE